MSWKKRTRIIVVDDEPKIVKFLQAGLQNEGFHVFCAYDGLTAAMIADQHAPHLAILDVTMPGMDGFDLCRRLKQTHDISIIMLTGRTDAGDRIKGLTLGADDFMVKPFHFEELLARIHARIRNQFPQLLEEIAIGPFRIDNGSKQIHHFDRSLDLSPTEYELLKYMIFRHGTVLSKSKILEEVWGYDFRGDANIVEVYVRSLRDKLHDREHQLIRTVRGAGYRMVLHT